MSVNRGQLLGLRFAATAGRSSDQIRAVLSMEVVTMRWPGANSAWSGLRPHALNEEPFPLAVSQIRAVCRRKPDDPLAVRLNSAEDRVLMSPQCEEFRRSRHPRSVPSLSAEAVTIRWPSGLNRRRGPNAPPSK